MKYPKVFYGDILEKDGEEFICTAGYMPAKREEIINDKLLNKMKYFISLSTIKVSVKYPHAVHINNTDLEPMGFTIKA